MKRVELLVGIFLVFLCVNVVAYGAEESLCNPDEILVASCRLNEKKDRYLSFCASVDKKTVTYRFGTESKIELDAIFSSNTPMFRWVDNATYTTYFGFRLAEYAYIFGVPQETLGAKAFLEVTKRNRPLMSRECTNNSFGEKELNSDAIQEVKDNVVRDSKFLFPPSYNSISNEQIP